eukprot:scaffold248741_cov23-Tisochrysis_lutea.AAC.2
MSLWVVLCVLRRKDTTSVKKFVVHLETAETLSPFSLTQKSDLLFLPSRLISTLSLPSENSLLLSLGEGPSTAGATISLLSVFLSRRLRQQSTAHAEHSRQSASSTKRRIRRTRFLDRERTASDSAAATACAPIANDRKGSTRLPWAVIGTSCIIVKPDMSSVVSRLTVKLTTSSPFGSVEVTRAMAMRVYPSGGESSGKRRFRLFKSESARSMTSKIELRVASPPSMKTSTSAAIGGPPPDLLFSTGSVNSITSTTFASARPGHDDGSAQSKLLLSTKNPDSGRGLVQSCNITSWVMAGRAPCLSEVIVSASIDTTSLSPPLGRGTGHESM